MVINVSFLYPLFFVFFSPGTSDALESGQRARTHSSWGQREREIEGGERETCDFSLYWMKSWGRLCFFCRLFLYKRSLHAVNSPVSRLAFTFLRGRRSPLCGGSEQPLRMSLWAIFDNKSIRSIVRPSSGDFFFQVTNSPAGIFRCGKATSRTSTDRFLPSFCRSLHTSVAPGAFFLFPKPGDNGSCNKPGDEPSTPGIFPDTGRYHGGAGDTSSEAGTRYRQIWPQRAEEETEPGGVDYRSANGPLRLWGKDPQTITGLQTDRRYWLGGSVK